jgi:hypothetical protein
MNYITQRPHNYDELNNLDLRSCFENEEEEPIVNTYLKAEGYVGNNPEYFDLGYEGENDLWVIDQYDEDGEEFYQSFLYTSQFEYKQDCKILGL